MTIATAAPMTIAPTNPPMTMNRPQVTPWVWALLAASAQVAPPITTTNLGTAAIGLGIPNDPRLARFTYMVQWGLFRSGGACNNLLELSNALQVVYER